MRTFETKRGCEIWPRKEVFEKPAQQSSWFGIFPSFSSHAPAVFYLFPLWWRSKMLMHRFFLSQFKRRRFICVLGCVHQENWKEFWRNYIHEKRGKGQKRVGIEPQGKRNVKKYLSLWEAETTSLNKYESNAYMPGRHRAKMKTGPLCCS